MTIVITSDEELVNLGTCLDDFCSLFAASISKTKTTIMGLGEWKGRVSWPLTWLSSSAELKLNGIHFTPLIQQTAEKNWELINSQILGILRKHVTRSMTISQRNRFIKAFCLSKAIYVAKVLACPITVANKILSETQRFLWYGQLERPKRGVSYEERIKGGINFRNPSLFFKSLVAKTFLDDLYGEKSPGKELMEYWTFWRLKELKLPTSPWTNSVKSDYSPPSHIDELLTAISELTAENVINPRAKTCHKKIYSYWIQPKKQRSKLESLLPDMNWRQIWRNAANLPPKLNQTMFLLNHRLLPTHIRKKRIDPKTNENCPTCNQGRETEIHVFVNCPRRTKVVRWLRKELRKLGSSTKLHKAIRGDFGPAAEGRKAMLLVSVAVDLIWRGRGEGWTPTADRIKYDWKKEIERQQSKHNCNPNLK